MKPPQIDPGLRELIGLSLIAGVACGLALSQFLIRRCFWCGMRSDDYRGDTTFTMNQARRKSSRLAGACKIHRGVVKRALRMPSDHKVLRTQFAAAYRKRVL
jgi:hypothetical protein